MPPDYQRAIALAQRAMELEAELAKVQSELAQITGAAGDPGPRQIITQALAHSPDEIGPSLSAQVMQVFRKNPGRAMTGEDVSQALGYAGDVNMIRSYLNRFAKSQKLKVVRRGFYQLAKS